LEFPNFVIGRPANEIDEEPFWIVLTALFHPDKDNRRVPSAIPDESFYSLPLNV
jgi:hypothetical protein